MVVVQINYEVVGEMVEVGTQCSSIVNSPVCLADIENSFPFEGKFKFRVKVPGKSLSLADCEYLWLDLVSATEDSFLQGTSLDVRAIMIDDSEPTKATSMSYQELIRQTEQVHEQLGIGKSNRTSRRREDRPDRLLHSAPTIDSVTKGVSSLWNTVKATASATASHLQQTLQIQSNSPLSEQAAEILGDVSDDASTRFNDDDSSHMMLLENVWSLIFPGCPFERESTKWKEAGFQTANPVNDLKTSGILALRCMLYLAQNHSGETSEMMLKNKANCKTNYPFAIVMVNIALLLIETFSLKEQKFMTVQCSYWELFNSPLAFFEIFCICYFHLNSIWVRTAATRSDFGKIIGEVKVLLQSVLANYSPKTIQQFSMAALDMGYTGKAIV